MTTTNDVKAKADKAADLDFDPADAAAGSGSLVPQAPASLTPQTQTATTSNMKKTTLYSKPPPRRTTKSSATNPNSAARSTLKQLSKAPGRRLVEYFVVVSSQPRKESAPVNLSPSVSFESEFENNHLPHNVTLEEHEDIEDQLNFEPVITARYPLDDHEDNALHQSVACFCHPSGVIKLKAKPCLPKVSAECSSMQ